MKTRIHIVDDIIFGSDPDHPLKTVDGLTWIDHINDRRTGNASEAGKIIAADLLLEAIRKSFKRISLSNFKCVSVIVDFDRKLDEALIARNGSTEGKGLFQDYLLRRMLPELPGALGPRQKADDVGFLVNIYGITASVVGSKFARPKDESQSVVRKFVDSLTPEPTPSFTRTISMAGLSGMAFVQLANEQAVALTPERAKEVSETIHELALRSIARPEFVETSTFPKRVETLVSASHQLDKRWIAEPLESYLPF